MNDHQQNFDDLKRLLKLKRHEVPPPGYFNDFSSNVVSRIRAGEGQGLSLSDQLQNEVSWLASLLRMFEAKPGVIGGFATALCLLLILGVVFADYSDRASAKHFELVAPSEQPAVASLPTAGTVPLMADGGIMANTNTVTGLQTGSPLFNQPGSGLFQTASFAPAH